MLSMKNFYSVTNYNDYLSVTFLLIMLRIMLATNITYYAGSSARIIAASLAIVVDSS